MAEHGHAARTGHRFPAERRHVLKDEERRRWLPPDPILNAAGIATGAIVIDVGAGTGFWTQPLARLVGPSGRVIATDVEPVMVEELRILVNGQGLENVEVVESEELSIPLPDEIADAAILGFVLHEPADPQALLHEVTRLLRANCRLLVVEWKKQVTEQGPPLAARLTEEESRTLLEREGYVVQALSAPNPDVYILLARRP